MKKVTLCLTSLMMLGASMQAQPPQRDFNGGMERESWEVSVNQMDSRSREKVNQIVEGLQSKGGSTRGVVKDILGSMLTGGVTAAVDVVATEMINLAKYKKNQKQKWMQMIERECNYTDSMSSIKGLKDFYSEVSTLGHWTRRTSILTESLLGEYGVVTRCFICRAISIQHGLTICSSTASST